MIRREMQFFATLGSSSSPPTSDDNFCTRDDAFPSTIEDDITTRGESKVIREVVSFRLLLTSSIGKPEKQENL